MRPIQRHRLATALIVAGAGLLGYWLWATLDARAFQSGMLRRLAGLIGRRHSPTLTVARATRLEARTSGLIGRIEIPRLGISAVVVEGTTGRMLRRGVGHVRRTAFPGERGNVCLAAHRDTWFRPLKDVRDRDRILLETPDGSFTYEVDSVLIVSPRRRDLLAPTGAARLTLVTCYPFYWVGDAPRRFVVQAHRTDLPGGVLMAKLSRWEGRRPREAPAPARPRSGRAPSARPRSGG